MEPVYRETLHPLTAEEEADCIRRFRYGDRKAEDRLVRSCLPFVVRMAKEQFPVGHWSWLVPDMAAEGAMGLLRAMEDFDENRGVRFLSYARHWIKRYIYSALPHYAHVIYWPPAYYAQHAELREIRRRMEQEQKRMVDEWEAARRMNLSEEGQEHLLRSWAASREWDEKSWQHPSLPVSPDTTLEAQERCALLDQLLRRVLDEQEYSVVVQYFGLDGEGERDLRTQARQRGLTTSRIQQILAGALVKVRRKWVAGAT